MSKIEQIIGELEEYIDSCRFQPLSNTKIIVVKDEIADLLDDLRQNIPDEVRKYQRIIANRDAIIRDAQDKADEMIRKANEMTSTLVSEHEIMQQAFREANQVMENANRQAEMILENATAEANDIKASAVQYTDESLGNIQDILNTAIEGLTVKYDGVMRSLESSLEVASKDRQALRAFYSQERTVPAEEEYIPDGEYMMPEEPQIAPEVFAPQPEPEAMYDSQMSVADALGEELPEEPVPEEEDPDIPETSDYGSVDEIKDFDLAFDDFK
ncbi:MAG: hypothetical protein IJ106_04850 [Parasporobacterium sp.]|nr:hypothetical protein [Parasporobacterium sp.]